MTSPADDRGLFEAAAPSAPAEHSHNAPARSVSELSAALKRTVEETYSHVRVRGEISQPKLAGSGHCYLRLKDDSAVIDAIIWRGSYSKLSVRPEEGLEVIAVGRLTTYPGRSSYQIVIESMELAGQGALLKMLEERRRRLAAEGLFAPERKRPLPFLPRTVGVITSPTGAVIRDILHRLNDRFPVHVLVWPVLVQGEGAAQQVARAVAGFNALSADGRGVAPRPDVLIVARGGGSLEDLMAFNEELVVRAVAASDIPVISAVGHETDTTLCDFAADLRAPTPTGAAEMVVPVRLDLLAQVREGGQRLTGSLRRLIAERAMRLEGLARGLPPIERLLEEQVQRLDERSERLTRAGHSYLDRRLAEVRQLGAALRSPREQIAAKQAQLGQTAAALRSATDYVMRDQATRLGHLTTRLRPDGVLNGMARAGRDLEGLGQRQHQAFERRLADLSQRLTAASERLQASSHEAVLRRGYALVRDEQGAVLSGQAAAVAAGAVRVQFHDGDVSAQVHGPLDDGSASGPAEPPARRPVARKGKAGDGRQESLF